MKVKITLLLLFSLGTSAFSQNIWTKIGDQNTAVSRKSEVNDPLEYQVFRLDYNKFKAALQLASNTDKGKNNLVLDFPSSEGSLKSFNVVEVPIMEPELAAKFPDIKSYIGTSNSGETVHFSVTLYGLHALVQTPSKGTFLIDAYPNDTSTYIAYNKSALKEARVFSCGTESSSENKNEKSIADLSKLSDGNLRTFRLAMACTTEYANFHISNAGLNSGTTQQKINAVLAAMAVTVTRVNSVYLRDLSLRLVFVANNDQLIFISEPDNFNNGSTSALITQSQTVINNIIGSPNYDIGHTVSTAPGGLAGLGVVCIGSEKARGVTGLSAPVGDIFDVGYVSHEMGHQFGANHTFNGTSGSCNNSNRNSATAVEPGSGSTIMAYSGICSPQNVQESADDYFHAISIAEMTSTIINSATCGALTSNGNFAPVVNAGPDYTIPKSTPFVLRGVATDANNDFLTYSWEQIDAQAPLNPIPLAQSTAGANFRSLQPSPLPERYFPSFFSVLQGDLTPQWEVIPNVSRVFNFAFTVRDNRTPNGGQVKRDDAVVTVNAAAGPFAVTSQSIGGILWNGNSTQTITWDVSGTTTNNINVASVRILLSSDGGITFPVTLSASTPNDGSETILVPNSINGLNCRIMIEAIGNIFYAVNSAAIVISPSLSNESFGLDSFALYPNPNKGEFTVTFNSISDSSTIKVNTYDISGRLVGNKTFQNNGLFNEKIQLNNLNAGIYMVVVEDDNKKETRKIIVQ